MNPALEALGGHPAADMTARGFLEIVHPDFRDELERRIEARMRGEAVSPRHEMKVVAADGRDIWLEIRGSVIQLDGKPTVMATVLDITEQKRVETMIRESELKFRTLAESTRIAIVLLQNNGVVYTNRALQELSGYSEDELRHLPLSDVLHPEDAVRVRGYRRERLEGREAPSRYETRLITKSRVEKWLEVTTSTFILQGQATVLTTALDITDRKRADQDIRDSEARFHVLLEHYFDGVAVVADGHHLYVNPTLCRMWGYDPAGSWRTTRTGSRCLPTDGWSTRTARARSCSARAAQERAWPVPGTRTPRAREGEQRACIHRGGRDRRVRRDAEGRHDHPGRGDDPFQRVRRTTGDAQHRARPVGT